MADACDGNSLGLDKVPNGVGQATHFLSASRSFWNGEFHSDATSSTTYYSTAPQELWTEPLSKDLQDGTTSGTGEHTYYSTAPQKLWTEPLSKDLQDLDLNLDSKCNKVESSCVEVQWWRQSDPEVQWRRQSDSEVQWLRQSGPEVQWRRQSDLVQRLKYYDVQILELLAEGGQAHVYFAECDKIKASVVVKRLKHGNVDLSRLQRRMERLMKFRERNNSAICRVFGVGSDFDGDVCWVVMERLAGDLRTLIDHRMSCLEVGQMPFDYNNTITMMMHIAQGMEDLHQCGLIHADLKASNILVTPIIMDPREEEVDGLQQPAESMYFYVKIGDFETSDGIVGTRFWRSPEVLQALRNGAKPMLSPAADVSSYGLLCYELLTGQIPFEECARSDYDVVLSGQRPELPAHVNLTMKELLRACWHTEPRERPRWTSIIKTLKEQLILHPLGLQQPKRRTQPRIEMAREKIEAAATTSETSNLVVNSCPRWLPKDLAQRHSPLGK
jgi:serine/threonine protein kinase